MYNSPQGFILWGERGRGRGEGVGEALDPPKTPSFLPPPPKRKGKEREKERERGGGRGGGVYVFGVMIYLITLRLAEYPRLNP